MKNKPYTYLIGWSNLNIWYYGCRWSKNCSPDDLWKTYFTSSKHVKEFIKFNGEPDVIQIRKIFSSKEECRLWEHKVLRRMNVIYKSEWLNKTDSISIMYDNHPFKGKSRSEETKKILSEKAKMRFALGIQKSNKGKKFGKQNPEFVEKRISKLRGRKRPDHSEKMKGNGNPMFGKSRKVTSNEA